VTRIDELTLVAHRGWPEAFPENSLPGYQQAVAHGATHVETDIQCTRDGVPVLYHDAGTRRLSGARGRVLQRTLAEMRDLSLSVPNRFGDRFAGTPIATLADFAAWLARHPAVTAFVEIKQESLRHFGVEPVTAAVMDALRGVVNRCVIISFDYQCVAHAATRHGARTGWVLPAWNRRTESRARELAPDYLFAETILLPAYREIWHGPWEWAVYVVNDLEEALTLSARGIHLVETDAIGDLLDQYRAGGFD